MRRATRTCDATRNVPDDVGRQRAVIERVSPEIDAGRFPIKRTPGESVVVGADIFADGHDVLRAVVRHRPARSNGVSNPWSESAMRHVDNDRWEGAFTVSEVGFYEYTVAAWVDRFGSWRRTIDKKLHADQDLGGDLAEGAALVRDAAARLSAPGGTRSPTAAARRLERAPAALTSDAPQWERAAAALDVGLADAMAAADERSGAVVYEPVLRVRVDRERARFGAWYEMFPRSSGTDPGRGATFDDAAGRLPDIAAMGFDVLYLPPIHPIGRSHRKGPNNAVVADPGDPGSPWAIGSPEGGHTAVEPGLGTLADFDRFVDAARRHGLEIALDLAFQCSPDHPWVSEHPEWFRHRLDGSIKYAENPPKKYQDIYPLDFETPAWRGLWQALMDVVRFWIGHDVRIFRVDNPHTKPFAFWEWLIARVHETDADVIFLSEAFTRPKPMHRLAKLGFTQCYSYFTWRNTKRELTEYFTELTRTDAREYLRPNLFANTPDILHAYLQTGGRPAFEVRAVLAATLGASYGIYSGFELCENTAVREGSEEYLDSEKYQIRVRDWAAAGRIKGLVTRLNAIRRAHRALQFDHGLRFLTTDNDHLLAYSKTSPDELDTVLVVVNLDAYRVQQGWTEAPLDLWRAAPGDDLEVEDLLTGDRYRWQAAWNYVRLDPEARTAHVLRRVDALPGP